MAHEVGAGQLAEEAGVPLRTIQYWSDLGILKAKPASDRRGRGKHRVYEADPPTHGERTWALIAKELHWLRLPIGLIQSLMDGLRIGFARSKSFEPEVSLERALAGKPLIILIRLFEETDEQFKTLGPFFITYKTDAEFKFDGIHFRPNRSGYFIDLTETLRPLAMGG